MEGAMSNAALDETLLEQLLTRMDRLEQKVDALSAKPGPSDSFDDDTAPTEIYDPSTAAPSMGAPHQAGAAAMEQVVERIDKLTSLIDTFGTLATRMPVVVDAAGALVNHAWDQAVEAGIDPVVTGQRAAALSLRAAAPEQLDLAERLLDNAPMLEKILAHSDKLDAAVAALDDVKVEDLNVVAEHAVNTLPKLAKALKSPAFQQLLDSVLFDEDVHGVGKSATTALVDTRRGAFESVGPFGAFFKMRDPDVARAVGFTLAVAKAFGQRLA
jgi:hypothetical protein